MGVFTFLKLFYLYQITQSVSYICQIILVHLWVYDEGYKGASKQLEYARENTVDPFPL